jgi:dTDP-4-dehydrorhamnose 3,5-epimerase
MPSASDVTLALPEGVTLRPLAPHVDDRGEFTEIFRASWDCGVSPVQWNAVRSVASVLRGVHVHVRHDDYFLLLAGRASIGLRDLRQATATPGRVAVVELDPSEPTALVIPRGVAHGFYFHEPSLHAYAVSHYWDPDDELACHWQDADLAIPWPSEQARLSERDQEAPPLRQLLPRLRERGL